MPDTETADIRLSDDGVVIVRIHDGASQSLQHARTDLASADARPGIPARLFTGESRAVTWLMNRQT
jgi:hypothetical protein